MSHLNKITIIIPTYSRTSSLESTLKSVEVAIGNTNTNANHYPLLISNNNIKDCEIIDKIIGKFSNKLNIVCVHNEKNVGQIANWNNCISHVTTKWFLLLHDDDKLLPNYLNMINRILINQSDMDLLFTTPIAYVNENKNILTKSKDILRAAYKKTKLGSIHRLTTLDYYCDLGYNAPIASLYKTETIVNRGKFSEKEFPISDFILHTEIATHGKAFILSEFGCIRGVELSESQNREIQKLFIEKSVIFKRKLLKEINPKYLKGWFVETSGWYYGKKNYKLSDLELEELGLCPKYNRMFYKLLYGTIIFIKGWFKPYYLQFEKKINNIKEKEF